VNGYILLYFYSCIVNLKFCAAINIHLFIYLFINMGWGSGIRDPGSGKKLIPVPDSWIKKALDSGSATLTVNKINNFSQF
jgi:hypothetical protein